MKKRLKLPNGYGSVSYRGDRRRRQPYAVKVSIKGKQVPIGYTETYEDGLAMLADYHKDPTRIITSNITFRLKFKAIMKASRCKHTPHECRHTLATWLDNAGANELSIKRILGHAAKGVTQKVYTHKSIAQLRKAIDLI